MGFIKEAGPQKKPLKEINFEYDECIFIVEYYSLFQNVPSATVIGNITLIFISNKFRIEYLRDKIFVNWTCFRKVFSGNIYAKSSMS